MKATEIVCRIDVITIKISVTMLTTSSLVFHKREQRLFQRYSYFVKGQQALFLRITPQAIFVPAFPDGWVVKSSGLS